MLTSENKYKYSSFQTNDFELNAHQEKNELQNLTTSHNKHAFDWTEVALSKLFFKCCHTAKLNNHKVT